MRKKINQTTKKQNPCDIGICFEALEPRLLLSGSWGAVVDGPSADPSSDSLSSFGPETVTLVESSDTFIQDALFQNQHSLGVGTFVDVLADAPALSTFDTDSTSVAAEPVTEAPSTANRTAPAPDNTPSNANTTNSESQSITTDSAVMRELVFVNDNVADYEQLIADLRGSDDNRIIEVVVIESDRNGIVQVSELLSERSGLAAVHFISHGTDGQINLGNDWLNSTTLQHNSEVIAGWGNALTETGDILFYGCNIAADTDGQSLLDNIAELTGAEVAASDDLTGNSGQGGDWDLEYTRGKVETNLAISSSTQPTWSGVLLPFTVSNTADSGAGSLRQAILDANANTGVTDTITFSIGTGPQTIAVGSAGLPIITDSVILDATTQPGYSGTPLITLDGSATPASSGINGINLRANDCTVKGFIVINFADEGIEMDGSTGFGDNNIIQNNWVGIDAAGNMAGNAENGIMISADANGNRIGGTGPNEGNLIAYNGFSGVGFSGVIINENSDNNIVEGNIIGLKPDGTTPAGNAKHGIHIQLSSDGNRIGGTTAGAGNVIAGNTQDGIFIDGTTDATYITVSSGTVIQGNLIGTDLTGTLPVGNGDDGISLQAGTTGNIIGGTSAAARNVISANLGAGVYMADGTTTGNVVYGNYIGTDAAGTANLGNGGVGADSGVRFWNAGSNSVGGIGAGQGNLIVYSGRFGVEVGGSSSGITISGNSIFANTGIGIDLDGGIENVDLVTQNDAGDGDGGANNLQNFPVLTSAVITGSQIKITGTLNSLASTKFRIEFYANATGDGSGYGEGQTLIGVHDVTTDGSGNATISAVLPAALSAGSAISATATRLDAGDAPIETSEFAQNVVATAANALWISADQDSGGGADGLPGGWREGEVLQFGGPDLNLGAATDGDFSSVIDFDTFTTDASDPGALHFVSRALTIGSGANQFDLQIGDVLVSFNQPETIKAAYYETGADTLVDMNDLLAFRPDTPGDYTSGTFYMLLNGVPDPLGAPINSLHAISLVEQDTYVGNTLLSAGSFIFSEQAGLAPNTPNHIYHFAPTDAGQTAAAGTSQILIDGNDINIEVGSNIRGLDLIEKPTTIGGLTFDSGDILVTLSIDDGAVGDAPTLDTSTSDIFVLKVTQSEPESGNTTVATAEMVLDGSLVNFDGTERVYAISVVPDNFGPAVGGDATGSVTEDVGVVAGNISDSGALTIADPDAGESFFVPEAIAGTYGSLTIDAAGAWTYTADNSQAAIQSLDDGESLSDELMVTTVDGTTQRVTITINGANDAPTISAIGDQIIAEDGSTGALAFTVSDVETPVAALTVSAASSNTTLIPDGNLTLVDGGGGNFTIAATPAANQNGGPVTITVTVDDGSTTTDETFTVTVTAANDAPVARPDGVHLSFDGDDFIQIADHSSLQMTNNVTMEAWINHSGSGTGTQIIFNKEGEYEVAITADTGEIKWAIADTLPTWSWHNTGHFVTPGEWTHVAVTYDGVAGEVKTYINGTLVETFAQSGPIGDVYTLYDDLYIGGRENAVTQRFEGKIDEVRVWSTTRTQGEIQANMNGQLTGAESGLAGNWRLNEGSGGVTVDQSPFGNSGTLGGIEGPSAVPTYEGYYTNEDSLLTVPAVSGVLANDFDADVDTLTVTNLDTTGMLGILVLDTADGSFTYDPSGAFESLQAGEHVIETFTYTANDGSGDSNTATVTITVMGVNDAPTVANLIPDQVATEDSLFTFQFAANTFADVDVGDTLTYTSDASGWLSFNAATRTFSGTPLNADVGTTTVTVTADDGNGGTVSDTFDIVIGNTNDAPTVANPIPDQAATEDTLFTFQFAANTFADVDVGDTLTYTSDASGWLSFNAATRTFSGTPLNADVGTVTVTVTADDGNGGTVSDTFDIVVGNTNNAPTVANPIPDQVATEDAAFSFTFAANTFADVDAGDTLTYTSDASGWLSFNAATRTFSGTPLNADVGTVTVTVTADDGNGGTVSDTFDIVVGNSNDAPTVVNPIADQMATEDTPFTFTFAANTFNDVDTGDTLTYTSDASGWLSFNAATRTFSGTPLNADVGTVTVTVTADDGNGGTVSDTFDIVISNTNDAPTVANLIPDQAATEDTLFTFQFAANTFADVDMGDTLTYTSDASGWLSFNAATRTFSGTPLNADVGTVTVTVTADDGNGDTVSDTFDIVVGNSNDAPTGIVTIDNMTPAEGDTLTASNSLADEDGLSGPISYQWYLDGVAIGGETGTTYTTVSADVGGVITVIASYTDDRGTFESVTSAATAAVTNVNNLPTGSVMISGTPTEDQTLTAANTLADVDGMGPVSYQWQSDGINIAGATGSTYTLGDADVGTFITVIASYTDGQGTSEFVTSAQVGPVANVNDAPVVGGMDTGAVTKGDDPDTDGLLEAGGVLTISDPDAGESSFQAETVVGSYGTLTIDAAGNWNYAADNTHASIQQLNAGENLTDVLTVTTADGTTHNVTITLNGADDSPLADDSSDPVDEGGTDPDPEDDGDPIEPEPDEVLPVEEELPPPEEIGSQSLYSSGGQPVSQSNSTPLRRFGSTIALRPKGSAYLNATATARYLGSINLEAAYRSLESRIEGNFIPAATVFFSPEIMAQALDHLQRQIDETLALEANQGQLIIGAAAGFGASIMIGYVLWAFRGASLLLGALSAMPMWRSFDPLPVLLENDKERDEEDDEKRVRDILDAK